MKVVKLILTLFLFAGLVTELYAQHKYFVGGGFNYSANIFTNSDRSNASYSVTPMVGMKITDNWQVGLSFGYTGFENTVNDSLFTERGESFVRPFVRYRKEIAQGFGLYGEFGLGYGIGNYITGEVNEDFTVFRIYLGPGIDYALAERWILLARWGGAQYFNSSSDFDLQDTKSFSFNLNMSRIEFGLNYFFH